MEGNRDGDGGREGWMEGWMDGGREGVRERDEYIKCVIVVDIYNMLYLTNKAFLTIFRYNLGFALFITFILNFTHM